MKNLHRWRAYMPLMIGSFAVILFSTAGIASMMGWRPALSGSAADSVTHDASGAAAPEALPQAQTSPKQAKARAHKRCAECGQVVSMTEITGQDSDFGIDKNSSVTDDNAVEKEANSATRHNIVVRMADGSNRVFSNVSAAQWRVGERVIVIAGTIPSHK